MIFSTLLLPDASDRIMLQLEIPANQKHIIDFKAFGYSSLYWICSPELLDIIHHFCVAHHLPITQNQFCTLSLPLQHVCHDTLNMLTRGIS
jgi:hypothetical protein